MAVSTGALAAALRITNGSEPPEPQLSILNRLLGVATETITATAPDAPEAVRDQAVIQMAAYMFDMPTAPGGPQYASAFRNSGALALLATWIEKRAGVRAAVGKS